MCALPFSGASQAVDELLATDPAYFLDFSIVIAVNLPAATEDKLADLLWSGASACFSFWGSLLARVGMLITLRSLARPSQRRTRART